MKAKINKLVGEVKPYEPAEMPRTPTLLPDTIVKISTGNPKWDEVLTKHLNQNKEFRREAGRILKKFSEAEARGILNGTP